MRDSSKGEIMSDNNARFWEPVIRVHGLTSGWTWLLQCVVLLFVIVFSCVPAAAQCDAFVAQNASNSVWVINTLTDTAVAVIPVDFSPFGVAITPNGAFAYVTNTGIICDLCPVSQPPSVSVIDTASYKVVATIPVGLYPAGVAISPNGAFAYVANFNSHSVSIISTTTNSVVATLPMGSPAWGVASTPSGAAAYVTNPGSNSVSVINTATNTVVASVAVGCGPTSVAITPNGAFAYVTNSCDSTVSVINTATNTVVATVAVGSQPQNIAITPDGSFAYPSNFLTGNLSVIDTTSNTVVDTVQAAGTEPLGIAIKLRPDALTRKCR